MGGRTVARFLARLTAMNDGWAQPFGAFNLRWTRALFRAITPIRDLLQGRWLGHPLHAAITDIPIGLLLGSVVLDVIGQPTAADITLVGTILFMVCGQTLTADALQGTWQEIDALTAKTTFGPQTPIKATVQGKDICEGGGISRAAGVLPPTMAGFQALLSQFNSNANILEVLKRH